MAEQTLTSIELYDRAAATLPAAEIDSHASDLYLRVTPASRQLIAGYAFRKNVTTFVSQIDQTLWYDVPFAYAPFWRAVARKAGLGQR